MSLEFRCYLRCESRDLMRRLGQEWLTETLQISCAQTSPSADTTTQTRRDALKLGWTRPPVNIPVAGHAHIMLLFDLCYRCSRTIAETIGELPS